MREQMRLTELNPPEPIPYTHSMSSETLVFAACPTHQIMIECSQGLPKRRPVEPTVVSNPAEQSRPRPQCEIGQRQIRVHMQLPRANGMAHRLGRIIADGRSKTDKTSGLVGSSTAEVETYVPGSRTAEPGSCRFGLHPCSTRLGFLRMEFQPAVRK